MKVAAHGENMSTTKQLGAGMLLLALSACNGTSSLDQTSHAAPTGGASGKTDSATLPPLHPPAVSILKDPRLIWDRKGVMLPIWGMGYNPNDEWTPAGYECFLDEPFIEEKDITESGYHLQASRSQEGDVFSFFVTGVHITRERYLSQLIWNEEVRAHLLAPKSQGGLEVSLQELNEVCGMGVLASLYGQYATIGFGSHLNEGESTPPALDLYFDNTPQGREALLKSFQPYFVWSGNRTGQGYGSVSTALDFSLDPDQEKNAAVAVTAYIQEAQKESETRQKLRDGDDLRGFFLVDKAPAHK